MSFNIVDLVAELPKLKVTYLLLEIVTNYSRHVAHFLVVVYEFYDSRLAL